MAFTDTSAISNVVQAAYDRYVEFALRAEPLFREVADKKPVQQAMPGSSVVFNLWSDLADATSALTETTDPTAVAVSNTSNVTVTLTEYGNTVLATRKLRLFSFTDVDPAIADQVAFNMRSSLDTLALTELRGGSNVIYSGTGNAATADVAAGDTLTSTNIRKAVAKLRGGKAVPRKGTYYYCALHPDVSADLQAETGAGGWRTPNEYNADNGRIWAGEIGAYQGAFFIETPRAYKATDGTASATVYRTLLCGKQALAEAVAEEPHIVFGNITDSLMRFRPVGWYGVLGFKRYREAALYRIESASNYT